MLLYIPLFISSSLIYANYKRTIPECSNYVIIILTATIVVTLAGFGIFGNNAQGQENLTEEQKAAMCDPSNPKLKFVNGTESRICGIPKTIKNATSTAANATTSSSENTTPEGIAPPSASSIAPSANTTTGGREEEEPLPSEGSIAPQILP